MYFFRVYNLTRTFAVSLFNKSSNQIDYFHKLVLNFLLRLETLEQKTEQTRAGNVSAS